MNDKIIPIKPDKLRQSKARAQRLDTEKKAQADAMKEAFRHSRQEAEMQKAKTRPEKRRLRKLFNKFKPK